MAVLELARDALAPLQGEFFFGKDLVERRMHWSLASV